MFHFKSILAAGAAAVALSACVDTSTATPVSAVAADRNVIITNATGRTIWRFYGSRVTTSSWEEDILGSSILPNGDSVNINFDDGTGSCNFDMKAEFRDGTSIVQPNINVCTVSRVTFR
ncbi:hypothetical protein [Yoonia litorea]|uniref:Uncharacterized protein n=1 Tax=Yoonia litorea TaxID=1123755 RepID=A0A1I6LU40_9RHOB|nr:hypothetical protein [Yoonia litorea]SFS06983.1 hypothetical protein SAMN05444714_0897 [Yoonia litorea]